MINWKSILSTFDDKPTLLQWLKLVEKALQESVLETVTVNDTGNSTISFTFTFSDGTSLTTPTTHIDTVKGDKGDKGDKGNTGVSITGVAEVGNEIVGNQTLTTLRVNFSNGTNNEVVVYAENGKVVGGTKLYKHVMDISGGESNYDRVIFYCNESTPITYEKLTNIIQSKKYIFQLNAATQGYLILDFVYTSSNCIRVLSRSGSSSSLTNKTFTTVDRDTVTEL